MTKPLTDIRKDLIAIIKKVIEENFDVEDYITESIEVMIAGVGHSVAVIYLNGLFLGTFYLEKLYVSPSDVIVSSIIQKIDSEDCHDLQGLFAVSVLR